MRVLHPREIRQLLAAVNLRAPFGVRDHSLVLLALHTGLRCRELVGLNVGHVAHLGRPRRALHLPGTLAKGGRERTVPLNATARGAVARLLAFNASRGFSVAPEAPLFVNRFHRRMSVRAVQHLVEDLRQAAGLDVPATPHSLRHSMASRLAACSNLRVVQKVLGHRTLRTVEIYTHPTREELEAAMARLD
jgi:site-specific recombinase XerD